MPEVSLTDWNKFLQEHPKVHLLQTGEWGEFKSAFGWDPIRLIKDDVGVQILFRRLPLGYTFGYIPRVCASLDRMEVAEDFLGEIDLTCRAHRAIFCKLEPDAWEGEWSFVPPGWFRSRYNIQPPRTIVIDLRGTEDEIQARMKQKTRYNIRLAEKKAIKIRAWSDLEGFYRMIRITGGRDQFGVHSLQYYRRAYDLFHPKGMCELFVAEYESRPIAALMVFAHGPRAWYFYGASTDEERNRMPTYLLQWEAMRWARSRGCEEYDLWGVPDEDEAVLEENFESRHAGLWGIYRFKRGFGGKLRRTVQALDKVYNPFLYKFYLGRMAGREGG